MRVLCVGSLFLVTVLNKGLLSGLIFVVPVTVSQGLFYNNHFPSYLGGCRRRLAGAREFEASLSIIIKPYLKTERETSIKPKLKENILDLINDIIKRRQLTLYLEVKYQIFLPRFKTQQGYPFPPVLFDAALRS